MLSETIDIVEIKPSIEDSQVHYLDQGMVSIAYVIKEPVNEIDTASSYYFMAMLSIN